jgi:replication factor A1
VFTQIKSPDSILDPPPHQINAHLSAQGGEIRASFWGDEQNMMYDMFEVDKVFYFSGGRLKMANKKYCSLNNEYEATFTANQCRVVPAGDEDVRKYQVKFSFVDIAKLEKYQEGQTVDIVGVVKSFTEPASLTSKQGREMTKQTLTLVDKTAEVNLTLWGEQTCTDTAKFSNNPILCIKGAKVSHYGGRSLNSLKSSVLSFNPDNIPETAVLTQWFSNGGASSSKSMTTSAATGGGSRLGGAEEFDKRATLEEVKDKTVDRNPSDKPMYMSVKATPSVLKYGERSPWYPACPDTKKKLVEVTNGRWLCESTQKEYEKPDYRYVLSVQIQDTTGNSYVSFFNDEAEKLLGTNANELQSLQEMNKALFESTFKKATWGDYLFKLRIKAESYEGKVTHKMHVIALEKVDFVEDSKNMLRQIHSFVGVKA